MIDYSFKFKWVDECGNETGFLSKRGHFDGETLTLDDAQLPAAGLGQVEIRGNRMVLGFVSDEGPEACVIAITKGDPKQLNTYLGWTRSVTWAEMHLQELEEKGEKQLYREATCPNCECTLVLSRMPETPQLFCHFCDTISSADGSKIDKGWRLCDECGLYSYPRKFTKFYFYFLIVFYGYNYETSWRCPACMRPEAWKMLAGNLLFLIGVPVAIAQLIRAYGSDKISAGPLSGLNSANALAHQGNTGLAVRRYEQICEQMPAAAGVRFNIGAAYFEKRMKEEAAEAFELALSDCANYAPAFNGLSTMYEKLGETELLAALRHVWDVEQEAEENDDPNDEDPDA